MNITLPPDAQARLHRRAEEEKTTAPALAAKIITKALRESTSRYHLETDASGELETLRHFKSL